MSTETVERSRTSLFARLISRERPLWLTVGIGFLLALVPFGAAYLDGALDELLNQSTWRMVLLPSVVIVYILVVSPIMDRMEDGVLKALRPLVQIPDDEFNRVIDKASRIPPAGEVAAFLIGAVCGFLIGRAWTAEGSTFWLGLTLLLSISLMFGLLVWTIYAVVANTRLMAAIYQQPLSIDIFDTKPFEPIGRQSLTTALVFVGGIVLSILLGLGHVDIFVWQNWLVYILVSLVPVLVFFLSMRDTHRVLAAEKKRELESVQRLILAACRTLMEQLTSNENAGTLAAEINALAAYEERVQAARTWPYNTAMLRTLFFSVIFPGVAALARVVGELQ